MLVNKDVYCDGCKLTEDEILEERILIQNEVFTNVFFNAGYMYQDVVSALELWTAADPTATDTVALDYTNFGIYIGDILIRFVWRRRFVRNFEY